VRCTVQCMCRREELSLGRLMKGYILTYPHSNLLYKVIGMVKATVSAKGSMAQATRKSTSSKPKVTRRVEGFTIKRLNAEEIKKLQLSDGAKANYERYLRRFAAFIEKFEPEAVNISIDPQTNIINRFNLPLPDRSLESFLEDIVFYDDDEGETNMKSTSTVEGLLVCFS
jgi:hypothetical protein